MRSSDTERQGWTLIELLAVVAIMALIAGSASLVLRGPLLRGKMRGEIDRLLLLDRTARSEARRFHRAELLTLDVGRGSITEIQRMSPDLKPKGQLMQFAMLTQLRLGEVEMDFGEQRLSIDSAGRSPTYAVKFEADQIGETWVVIAGDTGQPIMELTEQQIDELFRTLAHSASP